MSCKFASSSNAKPSFHLFSNSKQSTKTHFPESISFSSQVTKSRISIRNPPAGAPPRRARHAPDGIKAFYAPATECEESLYELLGIAETGSATLSDIKSAYKKMARKYHPDVSPPERVDEHTRRFIMVKEAYETLSNPQRRASYDRDLAQGFAAGKTYQSDQRMEEKWDWKIRWQSRLDELKKKSMNSSRGRMSWGARMRAQR